MAKNNSKNTKQTQKPKTKKGAVIGLSVALAIALAGAGTATALYLMNKGGDTPTTKTYKVTFHCDEAEATDIPAVQTIKENEYAVEPKSPNLAGHTFKTWVTDDKTVFNFKTTKITSDITLTATWSEQPASQVNLNFKAGAHGTFDQGVTSVTYPVTKGTLFKNCVRPGVTPTTDYIYTGWSIDGQTEIIDPETPINNETTIVAQYKSSPAKVHLTLAAEAGTESDPWTVEIKSSETTLSFLKSAGKKYSDIKSTLPVATATREDGGTQSGTFKYWSLEKQKTYDPEGTLPAEIDDDYVFQDNDIIYPIFDFETPTTIVELTVHAINDKYHQQTKGSGSFTIKVPYIEETIENEFGSINKPTVNEKDSSGHSKIVSKYYKEYDTTSGAFSNQWKNDDIIDGSYTDIYVELEEVATEPVVTFAGYDATEQARLTWVGMQKMKVTSETKLSDIAAPSVYLDATANPNPALGFITKYYFIGWYDKTDPDKKIIEDQTKFVITSPVTLCPKFEEKTTVVIQPNAHDTEKTENLYYLPETTWKQVATPTATGFTDDEIFGGWYAKSNIVEDPDFLLSDNNKVEDIRLQTIAGHETETETVYPKALTKADCHEFRFTTNALIDGTSTTQTIEYKGAIDVGVMKDATLPITVNSSINKPLIPASNTEGETNYGITFNNVWEIAETDSTFKEPEDPTSSDWKSLESYPEIAAGSDKKYFVIRPVITKNATIHFNTNLSTEEAEFKKWDGEHVIDKISVSTSATFGEMYKPEITIKSGVDKTFLYWATRSASTPYTYTKVEQNTTFTAGTTTELFAVYTESKVSSVINFNITDEDYAKGAKLNGQQTFSVTINDTLAQIEENGLHKFEEFAQPIPEYINYDLANWWYLKDGVKTYITAETEIPYNVKGGLNLFAEFTPSAQKYRKITIKQDSSYHIDGDLEFYVKDSTKPWDSKHQFIVDGFSTYVWQVGHLLSGWKDQNGDPISESSGITADLLNIEPVFAEEETTVDVSFIAGDTGGTIIDTSVLEVPIHDTILDKISGRTAYKDKCTFANEWKIYNGAGKTPTAITATTTVKETDISLVPVFIDEEVFEHGEKAYYYDSDVGKWADITSFDDPQYLYVRYSDDTVASVEKATFNYEVKIGDKMTTVPDNFMAGCSQWTNDSKPLVFPNKITSIGDNFLYGCESFNSAVTLDVDAISLQNAGSDLVFRIGKNFMRNCTTFNSKLSMNLINAVDPFSVSKPIYNGWALAMSDGFMLDCVSFNNEIELTGWLSFGYINMYGVLLSESKIYEGEEEAKTYFYNCLSSSDSNCGTFTIYVSADGEYWEHTYTPTTRFNQCFPSLSGVTPPATYRNIVVKDVK